MPGRSAYPPSAWRSSSQTCTGQYLRLHEEKQKSLQGQELIEYLLDSLPYIQTEDEAGYLRAFAPPKKPNKYELHAAMYRCPDCSGQLIDCTGSGVCEDCAVVAWEGMCIEVKNTMQYDRVRSTLYKIHRYNRLVHFKNFMRSIQAQIKCKLPTPTRTAIQSALKDAHNITPTAVLAALKKCKLSHKHRKHKEFIAGTLSSWRWQAVQLSHAHYVKLCRMFKTIERLWDKPSFKRRKGKRKVFMSYPYVFWRLCQLLDCVGYCKDVHLLKSKPLLAKQHQLWGNVCQSLKWRHIPINKIL